MNAADEQRFWSKVDRSGGADACWPWTGGRGRGGYGHFWLEGRTVKAHRTAARLSGIAAEQTLHRCDNPPCCNPAHLFSGTNADNAADRVRKGRSARQSGELHGCAKLTATAVTEIRARHAAGAMQKKLAIEFGVSRMTVSLIVRQKRWRHLSQPAVKEAAHGPVV